MKIDKYPEKFKPLFEYKHTGLMRTEAYMHPYLELGFDEGDVALLTELVFDEEISTLVHNNETEGRLFAPVHAVIVLAKLEAKEPFGRLLEGLELFDEDDDYYRSALIYYLNKVGDAFASELSLYFLNREKSVFDRMVVLEGVGKFIKVDSKREVSEVWEETLLTYLEREDELHDALNAFAVFTLVDLSGAKYIELIRRVFREKPVDPWYDGDLEEIEMRLGLRSKRSTPPPTNPFGVPLGGWDDEVKPIVVAEKAGRNDPCPCGSGKKYKKCCLNS